jgi:hypothetical membrane protein
VSAGKAPAGPNGLMAGARTVQPGWLAELAAAGTAGRQLARLARVAGHSVARSASSGQAVPVWAIVSAGLSPLLTVGGWLVAGALQPASYSPVRQTVSVMAGHAGTDPWIMTGALFLVGACNLVSAAGLRGLRPAARVLLVVAGMASTGIAACPEPVHGSTPQHLAWTALGAVMITAWPAFAVGRGSPRPLLLTARASVVVTAVFVVLLGWLVIQTQGGSVLGLAERLTSSIDICWPFIIALVLWRSTSGPRRRGMSAQTVRVPDDQAVTAGTRAAARTDRAEWPAD